MSMNIIITGLTACGKSYQSSRLAKILGFDHISASDVLLKNLRSKQNINEDDQRHFWIRKENKKQIENLRNTNNLDEQVDDYLLELCNSSNNIFFESRTLPWRSKNHNLIKIYLNPSLKDRAKIAYDSKDIKEYSVEDLIVSINEKDKKDIERFKKLYNIDISDTKCFGLVLDNGKLSPDETQNKLLEFINKQV